MKKLVLVKLGGSLITDKKKPFTERKETIKRLAAEIHTVRKRMGVHLVIGHGGGSYPHVPAKKYKTANGVANKRSLRGIAEVQDAAARLNRIITHELIGAGEDAVSLSPSSFMIANDGRVQRAFFEPLLKLLELNMLPVVYGDVVLDRKMGCCILSTEKILNFLAAELKGKYKIEKIIHCGITDGVYDRAGKVIPLITPKNFKKIKLQIGESEGIDVTGGMLHKVEESLKTALKFEIETVIINGSISGQLKKAILGEKVQGTMIKRK